MARDLNRWSGIGRLGKDVELRYMPNGDAVANFSIACGDSYTDKSGEKKEATEWVNLVAFRQLAEICGKYLRKGSRIYAEGRLTTRKWADKSGADRYVTEIRLSDMQMLDGKPADGGRGDAPTKSGQNQQGQSRRATAPAAPDPGFDESDIPF